MIETRLIERINNKSSIIGVLGLGYVGLPLVMRYAEIGYKVIGIDIDQKKVEDDKEHDFRRSNEYFERAIKREMISSMIGDEARYKYILSLRTSLAYISHLMCLFLRNGSLGSPYTYS